MEIHYLHKGISAKCIAHVLIRVLSLLLLVKFLCSSKRMVAVTHSVNER